LTLITSVQASMPHFPAPSHRLATLASAALILTLASACSTTSPTAPANPLVTGRWILDKSASDLVDNKVDVAVSAWAERVRKRNPYADNSPAPHQGTTDVDQYGNYTGEAFDMLRPVAPDYEGVHRRLVQVLTPPGVLKIDTAPDYVRITSDNVPSRDYHTDEEISRIDEYGAARIDAGWHGNEFELKARYYGGAILVEQFDVDAHSNTLRMTYHLRDPMVGKIEINSVYHRG
jgi:hypothetical protein